MVVTISQSVNKKAVKDILDLNVKIEKMESGEMGDDDFRKFRLARGVYGQRQPGVQMVRIKLPYGRMTSKQLTCIADCSDRYATSVLHATTRQDIQIHYVKLRETPQLWADLEHEGITLREACGNTVRNVTASPNAGIDSHEPFDVTPYAHAIYEYFLRNPICQDMGRKVKIALSSSEQDSAFTFMHDVGLIPRLKSNKRGFKIVVGGGLGAQPFMAKTALEWIDEEDAIPFIDACLRVFDRYGERTRRHKARIKFLIHEMGIEKFLSHVEEERIATRVKKVNVDRYSVPIGKPSTYKKPNTMVPEDQEKYQAWLKTNVYEQKQKGFYAIQLRVYLGDISSQRARILASIVNEWAADDIRVTVNQGFLLRFVREDALPHLFNLLNKISLAQPGFDSTEDIIACPGTSTCNLGITSSKGLTSELEKMLHEEYPQLIYNSDIKIKISGCMNGCGQHSIANIGFHGSTIKKDGYVMPALQVLLGGGFNAQGTSSIADKVTKIPAKRAIEAVRIILNDFKKNRQEKEAFNNYYVRQGKIYFFDLIKALTKVDNVSEDLYVDWGQKEKYEAKIGVGECAGVMVDLVSSILEDAEEKLIWARECFKQQEWGDAIYHAYNAFVLGAKAILTLDEKKTNTQKGIIKALDEGYVDYGFHKATGDFQETVYALNKNEPSQVFSQQYIDKAESFLQNVILFREESIKKNGVKKYKYTEPKDS